VLLKETGLDPDCLELEITESMLLEQGPGALHTLERMRSLGVSLSIDDFGTGYSSLAYLKRLPVHKLKIDQSFVRGIPDDLRDMEIAATIIAMARNLRLEVLAEGVETVEQLAYLRSRGCDLAQGYYFSPPVPAQELTTLLAAQATFA
jgi:EAL domain-containing protein (putative c-di-GMP-specific phosphodiesterase class I)